MNSVFREPAVIHKSNHSFPFHRPAHQTGVTLDMEQSLKTLLVYNGMAGPWAGAGGYSNRGNSCNCQPPGEPMPGVSWLQAAAKKGCTVTTDRTHQGKRPWFVPLKQLRGPAQTQPDAASVTKTTTAAPVMPPQGGRMTRYAASLHENCQTRVCSLLPSMGYTAMLEKHLRQGSKMNE